MNCFVLQKEVPLGNPDVLVCSVGTEIFFEATGASPEANQEWKTELDQGWNRQEAIDAAAKFSELKAQVLQISPYPVINVRCACLWDESSRRASAVGWAVASLLRLLPCCNGAGLSCCCTCAACFRADIAREPNLRGHTRIIS